MAARRDHRDLGEITATYGWRRVQAELDDMYGQRVNHKLVRAVMRELGIAGLPKLVTK